MHPVIFFPGSVPGCGHIKNSLSDRLYGVYAPITDPQKLWSDLEFKYKQQKEDYTLDDLLKHLRIEEEARNRDKRVTHGSTVHHVTSSSNLRIMNQEFVKLDKFDGCNYTRWADKMKFLLIVLKIFYVLDPLLALISTDPVAPEGKKSIRMKFSSLRSKG
nr:copia-like retrotransposon [Tanacetum cinerariifolium]